MAGRSPGAALHLLRGRQLDVHVVPLDPDRKDLDPVRLAAQALPRFEREGLLVHGAGDLGDALLIAEDAAREDRLALVRAGVLAGVPLAPGIEPEHGDLRIAVLDRAAAVEREVAHRPDADPSGSGPVLVRSVRPLGRASQPDLLDGDEVGRPAGGVLLAPLRHELHARGHVVGVGELLEEPPLFGVARRRPSIRTGTNPRAPASAARARRRCRAVVDDHVAEVLDPPLHLLEPDRRPGQPVGGPDVVHEEPVEVPQRASPRRGRRRAGRRAAAGRRRCRRRRGCSPSRSRSGRSPCPGPRRTRGRTPRRPPSACAAPGALVALLDPDGEADRVLHAVPAPGRADAALHRPERLAVGVPALEARRDQLLPDVRAAGRPARRTGRCAGRP